MKVFVEGELYPLNDLKAVKSTGFYKAVGSDKGQVTHVGYCYSFDANEVIYILPKVFIDGNGKVLSEFEKDDLIRPQNSADIRSRSVLEEFKNLLLWFYKSLLEYNKRHPINELTTQTPAISLSSNIGKDEYSYLDLILNILKFYKENKHIILLIEKKHRSSQHRKVGWERTVRKTEPFFSSTMVPVYSQTHHKKKAVDNEEELLTIFFSVLLHIKSEYKFNINIDPMYEVYKGKAFSRLYRKAPEILKKIRYKYFSDTLKTIHKFMELYFNYANKAKHSKTSSEYILVDKYHIIFEDMIDKLFSDQLAVEFKKLKEQKDGKQVDHLFEHESLLGFDESIFYIGDSKYYKTGHTIGEESRYKQFTYARNIIQFNIDLYNKGVNKSKDDTLRYRDEMTEGYNISPNFFIQGKITPGALQFDKDDLTQVPGKVEHSYHFENRLFDRDTLFIHYYTINFLFVLKLYGQRNTRLIESFRSRSKSRFKACMIEFLNQNYSFFNKRFDTDAQIRNYINSNFKALNGKMYSLKSDPKTLLIAVRADKIADLKAMNFAKHEYEKVESELLKIIECDEPETPYYIDTEFDQFSLI